LHSLEALVPAEMGTRLELLPGRFPRDLAFPGQSLLAIHASNVLHFLNPLEFDTGIRLISQWLVPHGKIFILATLHHQTAYEQFIPNFEQRKKAGARWPGWIGDLAQYSSHPTLQHLPPSINLFDAEVLSAPFAGEGFIIEIAKEYSR